MAESYCDAAPSHEWHGPYHNKEYGFPLEDDAALFERLMLEINQAGLSWLTILKKREAFRRAYGGFDPAVVAAYGARDRKRLLGDAGIIHNRLKVDATFRFTGGEIVGEFLMSIGYLPGAHVERCPVYRSILKQRPAWSRQHVPTRP
jgi:DNA-3-methyladenine glycosylase I